MSWKACLIYYLTYLDRYRTRPFMERLSYLIVDPTYQDKEYQDLIRLLAEEA